MVNYNNPIAPTSIAPKCKMLEHPLYKRFKLQTSEALKENL